MDRSALLVCFTLIALSGCADVSLPDEAGEPAQTASGAVSTSQQSDGTWKATRTEIGHVPFAAGDDVEASTAAGAVTVNDRGSGQAKASANLWARGDTEKGARDRLATLRFELGGPGVQAHVVSPGPWTDKGGSITIQLPTKDVDQLTVDVSAGAIAVSGIHAGSMSLETSAGAVTVTGKVNELDVSSSSGAIDLNIDAMASGTWTASTSAGAIVLEVTESSQRGYDMQASTTAGSIQFDFDDTEVVSSNPGYAGGSRHERTNGYSGRAIQTEIDLTTSAGQIVAGS